MSNTEVEQELLAFLRERFGIEPSSPDADLIQAGLLDSMMFVEVVVFIEERFGVVAGLDDLEIDNFATVAGMARFVAQRIPKDRPATVHRL